MSPLCPSATEETQLFLLPLDRTILQNYYQETLTCHPRQLCTGLIPGGHHSGPCVTCPQSCSFGDLSRHAHHHHTLHDLAFVGWYTGQDPAYLPSFLRGKAAFPVITANSALATSSPALMETGEHQGGKLMHRTAQGQGPNRLLK